MIAILTPVCGLTGWALDVGLSLQNVPEILVRTMRLYIPSPDVIADQDKNVILRFAATLGALSGAAGALAVWMAAANTGLSHLVTRFFRRGHTLVLGGTPFAGQLATALSEHGVTPVHVSEAAPENPDSVPDDRRLVLDIAPDLLARRAGLLRAGHVAIDMGSDADTLVAAKPLLTWLDTHGPGSVSRVSVRVADPTLADLFIEFARRSGIGKSVAITAFDENLVAARQALSSHPLFLRAAARHQSRVHAIIVGFGDFGEKLFDQIMLTSIAGDLGAPRVTVIDRNANRLKRAFDARRPAVCDSLLVTFVELDVGGDPLEGAAASNAVGVLNKLERDDGLTGIYLALPNAAENIRAALLLQRHRERTGMLAAPIFYRSRGAAGSDGPLLDEADLPLDAERGYVPLAVPRERLAQTVLGERDLERLAQRLHDNYRQGSGQSDAAARDWSDLPETLRRSNIRAADHLKAKLWTLGVHIVDGDQLPELTQADTGRLQQLRDSDLSDPALAQLARIEHDRWMIDRKLDGWAYGKDRDDVRRIHPKLVPFDDLSMTDEDIHKDVRQILSAIDHMLGLDE